MTIKLKYSDDFEQEFTEVYLSGLDDTDKGKVLSIRQNVHGGRITTQIPIENLKDLVIIDPSK